MKRCKKCKGIGTIYNDGKGPIVLAWFAMQCPDCNGTGKDQLGTRLMNEYDMIVYKLNNDNLTHQDKMEGWKMMKEARNKIVERLNDQHE